MGALRTGTLWLCLAAGCDLWEPSEATFRLDADEIDAGGEVKVVLQHLVTEGVDAHCAAVVPISQPVDDTTGCIDLLPGTEKKVLRPQSSGKFEVRIYGSRKGKWELFGRKRLSVREPR
jgi:hypothetical protein